MVFNEIAEAFGGVLGVSPEVGGYIAGIVLIFVFLILVNLLIDDNHGSASLIVGTASFALCVLVGWIPIWVVIFIAIVLIVMLIRPLAHGSGAS